MSLPVFIIPNPSVELPAAPCRDKHEGHQRLRSQVYGLWAEMGLTEAQLQSEQLIGKEGSTQTPLFLSGNSDGRFPS